MWPSEPATFCAQPMPAQQTAIRSPPSSAAACCHARLHLLLLADVTGDELEAELRREPVALLGVDVGDRHVRAPLVQSRTVASPSPEAPPTTSAALPSSLSRPRAD